MKVLTAVFAAVLSLFFLALAPSYLPEKADVVIIGAGAAGMRAAAESSQYTDRIILLEKMPYPGGNSNRATAGFNAVFSDSDQSLYIEDTLNAGRLEGKRELVGIMVQQSGASLKWLQSRGADLADRGLLAGHRTSRTYRPTGGAPVGREITSVLNGELTRRKIDLRTENKALSIVRRKRNLIVRVENGTGREYTIRAPSVIIATGGFGGNPEMVVRYNPSLKGFNSTNSPGADGDFISLTKALDAKLVHLEDIQTHPTVEPDFGILITEALRGNGGILVNTEGRRFTDEMAFREVLSLKILQQKESTAWLVFDRSVRESLQSAEYYFKAQLVREGATIEDLAAELSLSAPVLSASIQRWNKGIATGEDADFHRRDIAVPLVQPPYYAIKVTPGVHYCMGGLAIDSKTRVLDSHDRPIPGLYAAGEATGGIHGKDRLGGNSLTDAMVFGRIAGEEAAFYALNGISGSP